MLKQKTLYDILGVNSSANEEEIKQAFKEKAKHAHPDIGGDEEEFKAINEAYTILMDENKRIAYDITGEVLTPQEEQTYIILIEYLRTIITNAVQSRVSIISIQNIINGINLALDSLNKELNTIKKYKQDVDNAISDIKHKRSKKSKVNCFKKARDNIFSELDAKVEMINNKIEESKKLKELLSTYYNKDVPLQITEKVRKYETSKRSFRF